MLTVFSSLLCLLRACLYMVKVDSIVEFFLMFFISCQVYFSVFLP